VFCSVVGTWGAAEARIVDHGVEAAAFTGDALEQGDDGRLVGDIAAGADVIGPEFQGALGGILRAQVRQNHPVSCAGEGPCCGPPDAVGGPGDQSHGCVHSALGPAAVVAG